MAATMALVARDIKRVLAFSTISQLGYMMAAVGAGAAVASFYHLTTHAWFKALLFLSAGSMIHAVHSNDIFDMGRLWRRMPVTGIYFLVGGLALAGVWPLAGFFSKDEILIALWHDHPVAAWILLVTAGLTAFYMFRVFFAAFFGSRETAGQPHESPAVMTVPMGVLALLAVVAGASAGPVAEMMQHSISVDAGHAAEHGHASIVPLLGTLAAVLGILLAFLGYQVSVFRPAAIHAAMRPISALLERRYFIDDLFLFLYRVLYLGLSRVIGWCDRYLIDGLVNFATWLTYRIAGELRRTQTGRAQDALYAVAIGVLLLALLASRL
jgi:NADH-quinone oxidoreductase subunit L